MRVLLLALATVSSQVMGLAQMGSPGGGETQVIALHPTDPGTLYAGAAKGLCKTTSGGKDNWPSSGLEALSPRAIVLDRSKPQVLYVGTYEMGVYKSTDGARSWSRTSSGITNGRIRGLVIDPENGQIVYAGTDGGGVFKTVDGGKNWREANRGLVDKTLRRLVGDPGNAEILYAGTWHGVYKSTEGGEIWSANRNGLYDIDVRAIAIDPSNSSVLYAATSSAGVFKSTDGGQSWNSGKEPLTQHILALAVDPTASSHVYAGTTKGVFRSIDGGSRFRPAGLQWSNRTWTLVFDTKTNPPTLYYGGEGGVLKTTSRGMWWDVTGPQRN